MEGNYGFLMALGLIMLICCVGPVLLYGWTKNRREQRRKGGGANKT